MSKTDIAKLHTLLKEQDADYQSAFSELAEIRLRHDRECREAEVKLNKIGARLSSLISCIP